MTPAEVRAERIAVLEAKLASREDQPGMAANVAAIRKQIADLRDGVDFRDSETGQFVTIEHAIQNPGTTERVEADQ